MTFMNLNGARLFPQHLNRAAQATLLQNLRDVQAEAPFRRPVTPGGRPLSVRMTAAGEFGWTTDANGYRYAPRQANGASWPAIPTLLLDLWAALLPQARAPECCLVNFYGEGARMGLHQDNDEADLTQPVLSVSLGDEGLFRVGGTMRGGATRSVWLRSGDVVILQGDSRLAYHGVDRIRFKSAQLLPKGGRINVTLRVVT